MNFISETVHARRVELGITMDVTDRGGPSRTVMGDIERNGNLPKSATVKKKFAKAMRWEPDACERLERGEVPINSPSALDPKVVHEWITSIRIQLDILEQRLDL